MEVIFDTLADAIASIPIQVPWALLITTLGAAATYFIHRDLERKRSDERHREHAIIVTKVITEWTKQPVDIPTLNNLVWEATIQLPRDLLDELNKLLLHRQNGGPDALELVSRARHLVWPKELPKITRDDVVHFPNETTSPQIGIPSGG